MKQTRSLIFLLVAFILICNCGGPAQLLPLSPAIPSIPDCIVNGRCSISECTGDICKEIAAIPLHVEIEPSPHSGYVGQQHLNVTLGQLFGRGLELRPMVTYSGTLQKTKNKSLLPANVIKRDENNLNSEIIAIPVSQGILGNQIPQSATADIHGSFSLNLVAGQQYRVIANPLGLFSLPPAFFDVKIDNDFAGILSLPSTGRRVVGVINQSSSLSNQEIADKLWIRVVQGKRQISSLGRLSPDGQFSVVLANTLFERDTKEHPVELVIEPLSDLSFFPTKKIPISLRNDGRDIQVGTIELGPFQALIRARFSITGPENEPVQDARIFVRSLLKDGFLQSSTSSDEHGLAEIIIPTGNYDVAVIPKQDDTVGFRKIKDAEFRNSDALEIRLERRSELASSIRDDAGLAVRGARMVLTRFARADSKTREAILDSTELRLEAMSNDLGQWCVLGLSILSDTCRPIRLDSGRYRLSVAPPEGSRHPFYTHVFDFPEKSDLPIVLKRAIPLTGRLLAPKAEIPVPNAFIRIYSSHLEKESGAPIFLAQGFSRADGTFFVDLPQEYVLGKTP